MKIIVANIRNTNSFKNGFISSCPKKEDMPDTKSMSKSIDPRIFPRPSCRFPFFIIVNEVTSSGMEVPIARMKYPMYVCAI